MNSVIQVTAMIEMSDTGNIVEKGQIDTTLAYKYMTAHFRGLVGALL